MTIGALQFEEGNKCSPKQASLRKLSPKQASLCEAQHPVFRQYSSKNFGLRHQRPHHHVRMCA